MSWEKSPEYTSAELIKQGWTPYAIRTFLTPTRTENKRFFFKRQRVSAAEGRKDIRAYNAKRAARDTDAKRLAKQHARYAVKYGSWQGALTAACAYLFELNRYTKHISRWETWKHAERDEIYALKNQMVELLYHNGYATECYLHKTGLKCRSCSMMALYSLVVPPCEHCGGTGIYKTLTFVCFRFLVDEKYYCWHQPDYLVKFEFATTALESAYDLPTEEKPVSLAPYKFADAKRLIKWVIETAAAASAISQAA
jgi:hypothetical protein